MLIQMNIAICRLMGLASRPHLPPLDVKYVGPTIFYSLFHVGSGRHAYLIFSSGYPIAVINCAAFASRI